MPESSKQGFSSVPEVGGVPEHLGNAMERVAEASLEDLGNEELQLPDIAKHEEVQAEGVDKARKNLAQVIEERRNIFRKSVVADDADTPVKPKGTFGWFTMIDPQERVKVCQDLILTKQRPLMEVIEAFLYHEDFSRLDELEASLSGMYDQLVENGVLKSLIKR